MTTTPLYMTAYERRLKMVEETLSGHTKLGEKETKELAAHVLRALDHIPERVR